MFFFRGSALQVFGQCGGAKCGLGFAKLFSGGKDLAKPRLTFVFAFCPRGGGVWGGIRADFFFGFLAGAGYFLLNSVVSVIPNCFGNSL